MRDTLTAMLYTHSKEGGEKIRKRLFPGVQLCVRRENNFSKSFHQVFFFFAGAISARENLTGHRLLHRETTSEPKEKEKKK
jgi:hypothetical protein